MFANEMSKLATYKHALEAECQQPANPPRITDNLDFGIDHRTSDLVAASLAAGMIAAGGGKLTAKEAVQVWRSVRKALASPP